MNVNKKKDKFLKRLGKAKNGDTVKVINFKRKHFKKEMTTSFGFGVQDLKDDPKEFYKWLIIGDYDIHTEPTFDDDFGVMITMKKVVTLGNDRSALTRHSKSVINL